PSVSPLPRAADRGGLELLLAGAGAAPLLELDGAPAPAAPAARRERQPGGRRTDPLPAPPSAPRPRAPGPAPAPRQLRRGLRLRPAQPGAGQRTDRPVGALARRSLLRRRPDAPAAHRPPAPTWRQVRL